MSYKVKGNCIYKKDSGKKVGCTSGNIKKYLSALMSNVTNENNNSLVFDLDTYDYSSGQDYIKATLRKNNKLVAYADLVRFEGKIYINFIESLEKGSGYGKELMRHLAKEYGYENLERSSLTTSGAKMRKELDSEFGFDYEEHLKKQNKHLKIEILNNIKNDLIRDFLKDNITLGYSEAWKIFLTNPNNREFNNYLNINYGVDFNDISSISEWFIGSKTNDNNILDEPPHPILKDLSVLFKIPNNMIQENRIIKRLKLTNKSTLPKIPVEQIFFHEKPELSLILDITKAGNDDINKNKGKGFKKEKVNVKMIVPTQRTVDFDNLESTKKVGSDTGAELVKHGQFYFVIDGHHRIANAIINDIDEIDALVFTNDSKKTLKENLRESILNELLVSEDYPSNFNLEIFKNLETFKERIKYCKDNLPHISNGSSRMVFKVDNTKVLKLAKNKKGLAQNSVEIELNLKNNWYSTILADVIEADDNALWVEMELAIPAKNDDFIKHLGYGLDVVIDYLYFCYYSFIKEDKGAASFYVPDDEVKNRFENDPNEFVNTLVNMMSEHIINPADFGKLNSYGIVNREGHETLVLIDFGINDEVYDTYYS